MSKLDYESIKELAVQLGRPASTLIALAPDNDPFYLTPARQAAAAWFAELWERMGAGPGMHIRRFHYMLVSQPEPDEGDEDDDPLYDSLRRLCRADGPLQGTSGQADRAAKA